MGFEPMNTGFADQRVSHFAIGAQTSAHRACAEGKLISISLLPLPVLAHVP